MINIVYASVSKISLEFKLVTVLQYINLCQVKLQYNLGHIQIVFERVHLDFAEYNKQCYPIAIDSYSKWIEAFPMYNITTSKTLDALRMWFAQFGLPEKIVTDNGPQFTSHEFKLFLESNGIKHVLTPPYKPSVTALQKGQYR